jgi:hypothetical protein
MLMQQHIVELEHSETEHEHGEPALRKLASKHEIIFDSVPAMICYKELETMSSGSIAPLAQPSANRPT